MAILPPPGLALVGDLTAWAIWGFYFSLFCASMYVLRYKRRGGRPNYVLIGASITIFILTTSEIILLSIRLYQGVIDAPSPEYSDDFFVGTGPPIYGAETILQLANMLVADATLIWRTWIVWNKRTEIVGFNMLLWFTTLGFSLWESVIELRAMGVASLEDPTLLLVIRGTIIIQSLTLVQNALATCLIASRLWRIDRAASAYKQSSLMPVIWVVVESGALYTALWIEEIATSATSNTPGLFSVSQLVSPIIGVTFSLITVRVGLGLTYDPLAATSVTTYPSNTLNVSVRRRVDIEGGAHDDDSSAVGEGGESLRMETISQKDGDELGNTFRSELD